jgi:hypothetical protein
VTARELIRWELLRARREAHWWSSRWLVAIIAGAALAAFVAWRAAAGASAGSHAWLAGASAAAAVAFMRVPFHLYWRADAALLAQLPIGGGALFAAAFARCVRAAVATTVACLLGALPLVRVMPVELALRHAALAGVLGLAAACLLPAVATWAAMIVILGDTARGTRVLHVGIAIAGASPGRAVQAAVTPQPPGGASAVLGALPGFASAAIVVVVILTAPWLAGGDAPGLTLLAAIAGASVIAIALVRASAPRVMGTILRDVSALDRQRLATLEIHPPTALERAIAAMLGRAALPYRKDARLMRRRYPMAFALGAFAFIVLAIVGLARPDDPTPWLVAVLAGGAAYGAALANRLAHAPIELRRLSATLPIEPRARAVAKTAWTIAWTVVFLAIPAVFALVRA